MKKLIYGIIILLVFFGTILLNDHFNLVDDDYVLSAMIIIPIVIILIIFHFLSNARKAKANQAVIPENVGARSYIDKGAGTIYLRSADYARKSGQEWVVTNSTITINLNNSTNSQTIPFPSIHTMAINHASPISTLSIERLVDQPYQVGDLHLSERRPKISAIINFSDQNIRIAEAIRDRVGGANP